MSGLVACAVCLCLLVGCCRAVISQNAARESASSGQQQKYEWMHYGNLVKYSQDSYFSLMSFTIPDRTLNAKFLITLSNVSDEDDDDAGDNSKVILSLRRGAIPILQAYNETLPESFILPSDQQTSYSNNSTVTTMTVTSPTPGRVYLLASILNPLDEVVDNLRWGTELKGHWQMSVTAIYTMQTAVPPLAVDDVNQITSTDGLHQVYSFRVPAFTTAYTVIVNNCQTDGKSNSSCNVTLTVADTLAVGNSSSLSIDCRHEASSGCLLTVSSPLGEHDHYLTLAFEETGSAHNMSFDVSFDIEGCTAEATHYSVRNTTWLSTLDTSQSFPSTTDGPDSFQYYSPSDHLLGPFTPDDYRNMTGISSLGSALKEQFPACINLGHLGRRSIPTSEESYSFDAEFGMWTSEGEIIPDFYVVVADFSTEVRTFSLQDSVDSGGILYFTAELQDPDWQGVIRVCAMPHRVARNGSVDKCPGGVVLTLNASTANHSLVSDHVYLPFPVAGSWYLTMQSQCWAHSGPVPCEVLPMIQLSAGMTQCSPNQCGRYGDCQLFMDATTVFASCQCYAGYRGLSCEDDTHSLTDSQQLRAVYLLTFSNLAFIPAICLALYRHYFTLAAIFFFNAFFSGFYHACDASHVFQLCIMDYNTLAFCDYLGSVFSFYATLLTMARILNSLRAFFLVAGVMVIAVFQTNDRHNDLAHVLPLIFAGLVLIISWIRVMRIRRRLYPSKQRYLCFLLPGVVLAGSGIGVNYGLMWHLSTYQYTHSFWHISLMLTPLFLMPPGHKRTSGNKKGLSVSAQDIIRGGPGAAEQPDRDPGEEAAMFDASMNSINSERNLFV